MPSPLYLADLFQVGERFRRAVNIGLDYRDEEALKGYVVTPLSKSVLLRISAGLSYSEEQGLNCGSEHCNNTRRLASITEYGTDGVGGDSLPATTFGYTRGDTFYNKPWCSSGSSWDMEVFRYERLTSINNGYGGVITISYSRPQDEGNWCWKAFNYRVTQKQVADGQGGGHKLAYSYPTTLSKRCYDNNSVIYGCEVITTAGGSLVGYETVTETLKTISDSNVAVTHHTFKLNTEAVPDRWLGRELETLSKDTSGNVLQKNITTWASITITRTAGTSDDTYFVYAQWTQEYYRENGSIPATPQKKAAYAYEPSRQDGAQYGNLTYMAEYDGATLYRDTRYLFYPNSTDWIVDKAAYTNVCDASGVSQTKTRNTYDSTARAD